MDIIEFLRSIMGRTATEKVTKTTGVITSVSFDLYGCVQAVLSQPVGEDGKTPPSNWWDVTRLGIHDGDAVMPCPDFILGPLDEMPDKGPENKPMP